MQEHTFCLRGQYVHGNDFDYLYKAAETRFPDRGSLARFTLRQLIFYSPSNLAWNGLREFDRYMQSQDTNANTCERTAIRESSSNNRIVAVIFRKGLACVIYVGMVGVELTQLGLYKTFVRFFGDGAPVNTILDIQHLDRPHPLCIVYSIVRNL